MEKKYQCNESSSNAIIIALQFITHTSQFSIKEIAS